MKTRLLTFLLLPVALQAHPEIDKLVRDNRASLASAFAGAETVAVHAIESPTAQREIWVTSSNVEASSLHSFFQPTAPKFEVRAVDGIEEVFVRAESCFCFGQLRMTITYRDRPAISFVIFHGRRIGSERLPALASTPLDEVILRPFYERMMRLRKNG